jgi:3-dehydroquinate synthetase
VDFGGYKNLVGTFYSPRLVLCDPGLLASLSDGQFASGMAEAIKHAIIAGGEHFAFVERECRARAAFSDDATGGARLARLIELSQSLKLSVVGHDSRESGERRLLNLGHTIGHAIEAVSGLPHGHSVAAGMASAFRLAAARGRAETGTRSAERVIRLLEGWGLPSSIETARSIAVQGTLRDGAPAVARGDIAALGDAIAFRAAVAAALDSDKKRVRGDILFAMPYAVGDVRVEPVALGEIEDFVREAP